MHKHATLFLQFWQKLMHDQKNIKFNKHIQNHHGSIIICVYCIFFVYQLLKFMLIIFVILY
jgi:hypothetical protein